MKKIKKFAKTLIIKNLTLLILLLVFSFGNLFAKGVLAEEATPTETTVENSAQVENSVDQTADTGNNSIEAQPSPEPSPSSEPSAEPESSPDPSPSPAGEPSPTLDTSLNNDAQVENNVESTSDSGNNSISQPEQTTESAEQEATPSANLENQEATSSTSPASGSPRSGGAGVASLTTSDSAQVTTGDAISVVEAENSVNSTEVNSNVVNQTLNIFLSGDVDLTVVPYIIAEAVFAQDNQDQQVVNVMVFSGNNYAYLSNDIVSLANSGANSISGGEQATINTGDAYSVVSLVNRVNTTIIDSTIHIVTINIFGTVNGNIILPELEAGGACCGEITQIDNQASLENNVSSSAVSGQNEIVTEDQGFIQTGDSQSAVNVVNLVNTNIIGMLFQYLFINNFGSWNGNFLGWDDFLAQAGGGSLSLSKLTGQGNGNDCCVSDVNLENEAFVYNNISSTASTGGNSLSGGNGTIRTGRAYSAVSLLNFINTNIIRSIGFFGFVNIFGILNGDVGGESQFLTQETGSGEENQTENNDQSQDQSQNQSEQTNDSSSVREQGGQLKVEFSHNVGEYVLPGDTITFFVTVKNPGTGKVYGAHARISFILDGADLGGATFNLGDIEAGKGIKLSTGLVLAKDIKPGTYIARVRVWGEAGDVLVSDFADSAFLVGSTYIPPPLLSGSSGIVGEVLASESLPGEILGSQRSGLSLEQKLWILLGLCIAIYLMLRGIRERRKLALAFLKSKTFLAKKSLALRSILFNYFPPFL